MKKKAGILICQAIGICNLIMGFIILILKYEVNYAILGIYAILFGIAWITFVRAEDVNHRIIEKMRTYTNLLENKVKKLSEENAKLKNKIKVDIDEIIVPEDFTHPNPIKLEGRLEFYNKTKRFRTPIVVDKNYKLLNGYTSYLIAKSKALKVVEVIVSES